MNVDYEYVNRGGLNRLINFGEYQVIADVFAPVNGKMEVPFPPNAADLIRLHRLIRSRKCFTVLEFGCGYSTAVIADALQKNEQDWNNLANKPKIRNRFMFRLFSVDASAKWIETAKSRMRLDLQTYVDFHQSDVEIGTFNGQLCHYYSELPDIIPDFIYVDGPDPKDVKGNIRGLSFQCDERTVMSGDLLLMEPTFLPETFILFDGRTNNARFVANNFKRKYRVVWDKEQDITTFELVEEILSHNNTHGYKTVSTTGAVAK